jgi:DNA-binding transcriptional LysR family regulator
MNISFPDLRSFVTLAHSGNFHHTSLALACSQPALTRRIQKLEETLGIQLFDRTTRSVTLTALGREFLPKAHALLEDFDASLLSISGMAQKTSGLITVACVPTAAHYFMPQALATYSLKFPHIKVKIVDEPANVVLTSVLAGDADLGLAFGRDLGDDISFDLLMEDPYVVACRPGHPLAQKTHVEWSELQPYPFIRAGNNNGNRLLIDLSLSHGKAAPNWLYEVQHLSSSLPLVEAGLGISVVSTLLMRLNHNPNIAFRPLGNPTLSRKIGILRRAGVTLAPAAQAFYSVLKDVWSAGPRENDAGLASKSA